MLFLHGVLTSANELHTTVNIMGVNTEGAHFVQNVKKGSESEIKFSGTRTICKSSFKIFCPYGVILLLLRQSDITKLKDMTMVFTK